MIQRTRFGGKDWQTTLAYHLNGLAEAAGNLQEHIRNLERYWGSASARKIQEALVGIYVELFQLQYHKKELRRPFERLQNNFYEAQEKSGGVLPSLVLGAMEGGGNAKSRTGTAPRKRNKKAAIGRPGRRSGGPKK